MNNSLRVAVVSIGRSGTSLIARILDEVLGVDFGDEADHIPRNHNNPDGYFENAEFLAFDDQVLAAANAWVLAPPALDYVEKLDPALRSQFVTRAVSLLEKYAANSAAFGWKDPRLSFTLPIWREACPNLVPIIAFRNPYSVLSSIAAQLERPVESIFPLWFCYYQHVFRHTDGLRPYYLSFDALLEAPVAPIMHLVNHLGLTNNRDLVATKLADIIKPSQSRHSSALNASNTNSMLDDRTNALYTYLSTTVQSGAQPDPKELSRLLMG